MDILSAKILSVADAIQYAPDVPISVINDIKPTKYHLLFKNAVIESIKQANKNDIVLLSPAFKSFDQFKNFEERGNELKKIVKKYYA